MCHPRLLRGASPDDPQFGAGMECPGLQVPSVLTRKETQVLPVRRMAAPISSPRSAGTQHGQTLCLKIMDPEFQYSSQAADSAELPGRLSPANFQIF